MPGSDTKLVTLTQTQISLILIALSEKERDRREQAALMKDPRMANLVKESAEKCDNLMRLFSAASTVILETPK